MENILVLLGAPRRDGNTETLTNAFVEGARSAGHHVEVVEVAQKKIGGCLGCDYCKDNEANECVQKDDMAECYRLLSQADVVVIATPLYFFSVSAQLKCLIDRLHNPIRKTFHIKKACLLSVGGSTRETVFDALITMYHATLRYLGIEDAGIVTVGCVKDKGAINGHPALEKARELGKSI